MQWKTALFAALCAVPSVSLAAQEAPEDVAVDAMETPLETQDVNPAQSAAESAAEAIAAAAEAAAAAAKAIVTEDYPRDPRPISWRLLRIKPADYPPSSWVAGEEGIVSFDVLVGADGTVLGCAVTQSSGYAALDDKSCQIASERTMYGPALDEEGSPTSGSYSGEHNWSISEPEFPGTATIHVTFDVLPTGESANCEVVEISGALSQRTRDQLERSACPFSRVTERNIYRDENGVPVAKTVGLKFEIVVSDPE